MPRPSTMTDQRLLILRCMVEYHAEHHFSPSHREMAEYVDTYRSDLDDTFTSTSSIRFHLLELCKREYIYCETGVARGYAPTQAGIDLIHELYPNKEGNHACQL